MEKALANIQVKTSTDSKEQESYIDQACSCIGNSAADSKVKLIIIDSMTFHYKSEYSEHSRLAKRAEWLNNFVRKLHHLAITKKITVVVTNHSSSNPDKDLKYSNASPFGGNVMSYASQYIINLTRGCKMPGA